VTETTKRKAGRPIKYKTERKPITIQWPVDLINFIDSVSDNRSQWLIEAARQRMQQEQDQNTKVYIKNLLNGIRPDKIPNVGEWERACGILTRSFDVHPDNVQMALAGIVTSTQGARLREILA
jgi:hypothetical protein